MSFLSGKFRYYLSDRKYVSGNRAGLTCCRGQQFYFFFHAILVYACIFNVHICKQGHIRYYWVYFLYWIHVGKQKYRQEPLRERGMWGGNKRQGNSGGWEVLWGILWTFVKWEISSLLWLKGHLFLECFLTILHHLVQGCASWNPAVAGSFLPNVQLLPLWLVLTDWIQTQLRWMKQKIQDWVVEPWIS